MRGRTLALVALSLAGTAAGAETLWVTDKLQVGIHEDRSLESAIVRVVPSGTALEVVSRDGSFVQVQTGDATVGWVDATYLSSDEPAATLVDQMRVAAAEQADSLERSREAVAELEQSRAAALERAEAAEQRLAALASELDQARSAAAEAANAAPVEPPMANEALRDVQRLAEENRGLKQRIAELDAQARMVEERASAAPNASSSPSAPSPSAGSSNPYAALLAFERWVWILLGSGLLLTAGLGAWIVDWRIRRRHGGFRV